MKLLHLMSAVYVAVIMSLSLFSVSTEVYAETSIQEISKESVLPVDESVLGKIKFTIGNENFWITRSRYLEIHNSRGLAMSYPLWSDVFLSKEYVSINIIDNILYLRCYDTFKRLLSVNKYVYNESTGKFGDIDRSECQRYHFSVDGESFYAELTRECQKRYWENDDYSYVDIYFADGTPTNIQHKFVYVEYGRTGGGGIFEVPSYIDVSGSVLTIRNIEGITTDSYDWFTNYRYDKSEKMFVETDEIGDIDMDKEVGVSDATAVLEMYAVNAAGLYVRNFTAGQFDTADLNADGDVSLDDASNILSYYAQSAAEMNPQWDIICPDIQNKPYHYPIYAINKINSNMASMETVYTFDTDGDGVKETIVKYTGHPAENVYDYDGFFRIYNKAGKYNDILLNAIGESRSAHSAIVRDPDTDELMIVEFVYSGNHLENNYICGISMFIDTPDKSLANSFADSEYMLSKTEDGYNAIYRKHREKCTREDLYSYFINMEIIDKDSILSEEWVPNMLGYIDSTITELT